MVSLRFPFSFSQPATTRVPSGAFSPANIACSVAVSAAIGAGISAGICLSQNSTSPSLHNALKSLLSNLSHSSPLWGSLSLSEGSGDVVTESKTGFSFPAVLKDSQGLLGIGLRRKAVFGLKNIDVYAFGVYADDSDIKNFLSEKYGTLSTTEDSVGNRLKKFGGSDNKELLQKFTSQFKDEYKIPRGSIIDLSKEKGYVLRTSIDGKEVGSVQSQLLCRSILDLYIGDEPFDSKAKEDIDLKLASAITNWCKEKNGKADGWTTPVNTSYSKWASSKKFRVGDTLWFHYDPASHNVVQVNQMGYQLCNISNARVGVKTYETGNDSFRIKGPGHYYFICSFPGHCKAGQKLDVRVLKKYPMTTPTPKTIAMAPTSFANALYPYPITSLLFGTIVVSIICAATAMWVA
ncbi:unnamed protein product [Lactuca virosa]|uniref:Phytocyanin domain-containing protein n=1 Tax=Lactuca virosa TaxID=75947 RepID=A0AAU9LT16_9ASTR|nr:unnamed protein product [Lactuca virosa]